MSRGYHATEVLTTAAHIRWAKVNGAVVVALAVVHVVVEWPNNSVIGILVEYEVQWMNGARALKMGNLQRHSWCRSLIVRSSLLSFMRSCVRVPLREAHGCYLRVVVVLVPRIISPGAQKAAGQ